MPAVWQGLDASLPILQAIQQDAIPKRSQNEGLGTQVALMFLTRGDMPHEASWAAWLRSAEGMVPIDPTQDALCAHKPAPGKCPWANGVRQVRTTRLGTMICKMICVTGLHWSTDGWRIRCLCSIHCLYLASGILIQCMKVNRHAPPLCEPVKCTSFAAIQ